MKQTTHRRRKWEIKKKDFPSNELRPPIHGRTEINLEQFGPLRRRALFVLAVATMDKRRPTAAGACHCPLRQLRQSPSVSVAKEISENGVKNFYANSKEKSISTGRGAHARPSTALQLATSPPSRSSCCDHSQPCSSTQDEFWLFFKDVLTVSLTTITKPLIVPHAQVTNLRARHFPLPGKKVRTGWWSAHLLEPPRCTIFPLLSYLKQSLAEMLPLLFSRFSRRYIYTHYEPH